MLETGFSVNCRAIGNLTTKLLIGFLFCFLVLVLEQVYSLVIMILLFSPSFKELPSYKCIRMLLSTLGKFLLASDFKNRQCENRKGRIISLVVIPFGSSVSSFENPFP